MEDDGSCFFLIIGTEMNHCKQSVENIEKVGASLSSETEEVTSCQSSVNKSRVTSRTKSGTKTTTKDSKSEQKERREPESRI